MHPIACVEPEPHANVPNPRGRDAALLPPICCHLARPHLVWSNLFRSAPLSICKIPAGCQRPATQGFPADALRRFTPPARSSCQQSCLIVGQLLRGATPAVMKYLRHLSSHGPVFRRPYSSKLQRMLSPENVEPKPIRPPSRPTRAHALSVCFVSSVDPLRSCPKRG